MRREYNKLVRDKIPEIIHREGREYEIVTMSEGEYRQALLIKLVEEAREAAEADTQKLVVELADLYEVIDAIQTAYNIDPESVTTEQRRRRTERGGFKKRIRLLWTQ